MTSQSNESLSLRDLAEYGVARFRDQAFDAIGSLWRKRRSEGWSQRRVADAIGRDPAWVSRNLRAPGNWTLRTIGELIQALDGEAAITVAGIEEPLDSRVNFHAYDGYVPARMLAKDYIDNIGTVNLSVAQVTVTGGQSQVAYIEPIRTKPIALGVR